MILNKYTPREPTSLKVIKHNSYLAYNTFIKQAFLFRRYWSIFPFWTCIIHTAKIKLEKITYERQTYGTDIQLRRYFIYMTWCRCSIWLIFITFTTGEHTFSLHLIGLEFCNIIFTVYIRCTMLLTHVILVNGPCSSLQAAVI
jgi:hypothetical protein